MKKTYTFTQEDLDKLTALFKPLNQYYEELDIEECEVLDEFFEENGFSGCNLTTIIEDFSEVLYCIKNLLK